MIYPYCTKADSEEETSSIAQNFASSLNGGEVVIINGNLGAGKTFFIKKAGAFYGINNVYSPTFSLVNEYTGTKKINHFDFYRINSVSELYNIGFDDYLIEEGSITFIEWGNLYPEVLPEHRIEIIITVNENNSREFIFEQYEPSAGSRN